MSRSISLAIILLVAALPAAADPILTVTPSSVALSPTQTVLTFEVDPNGTEVSTLLFNVTALASGLEIVAIGSAEPGIINTSGPTLASGEYQASFSAFFFPERLTSFVVGTLIVEGFTLGTPLEVSGEFTDSLFNTYVIPLTSVAVVGAPEPGTASLVSLGLVALAALGRRRSGAPVVRRLRTLEAPRGGGMDGL